MNDSNPVVSVVIPTFNRAHIISLPIKSVLAQTFQNFEIIVVDDCSTDNTREVVEGFSDSRIRWIQKEYNSGAGDTRNVGIRAAKGKYIAFLDSDDEWLPLKLEKQVEKFESSDTQVGVVYCWWKITRENSNQERTKEPEYRGLILGDLCYKNVVGSPSVVMVRRDCFETVPGFDPQLLSGEDWDCWIMLAHHYQFDYVPQVLCNYWDISGADRITKNYGRIIDGHIAILNKHRELNDLFQSYKAVGSYPMWEKAQHFFGWGRQLICIGNVIGHPEATKLGERYLATASQADPFNLRLRLHYLAMQFGSKSYGSFVNLENRMRTSLAHSRKILRSLGSWIK